MEPVAGRSHVLVVDASRDSREVICTMLQRHGWSTVEAATAEQGLQLARRYRPQVIVADLETDVQRDERVCESYSAESLRHNAALLMLGVGRTEAGGVPRDCLVPKPYHYGPLIRKIEQLCRRAVAEGERDSDCPARGKAA